MSKQKVAIKNGGVPYKLNHNEIKSIKKAGLGGPFFDALTGGDRPVIDERTGADDTVRPWNNRNLTESRRHAQYFSFPPIDPATISHQPHQLPATTFARSNLVSIAFNCAHFSRMLSR